MQILLGFRRSTGSGMRGLLWNQPRSDSVLLLSFSPSLVWEYKYNQREQLWSVMCCTVLLSPLLVFTGKILHISWQVIDWSCLWMFISVSLVSYLSFKFTNNNEHVWFPSLKTVLCFLQRHGSWGLYTGGVQQWPGWNNRPGSAAAEPDWSQGSLDHLQPLCSPKVNIHTDC